MTHRRESSATPLTTPHDTLTFIGRIPAELQHLTVYSAGIATEARQPEAGRELVKYLCSPEALPVLGKWASSRPVVEPRTRSTARTPRSRPAAPPGGASVAWQGAAVAFYLL
ncbi:substrate-binding domain-containing protein [Mesorhizobium sp. IMUNJ 23232]|uniref:substrate-binding domain-containing protein n=1 Tax=Mesorhizobium sp. IMUNJ 23232 TaxID=3376064 RepID=UPI0037A6F4D1